MSTASRTIDVLLPELGESVTEGVVVEWRVAVGDRVRAGDVLLDVTTDKVDVEVPAPDAGVIVELVVEPGETIAVGARLAVIGPAGEESSEGAPPAAPAEAPQAGPAPVEEPADGHARSTVEADGSSRTVPIVLPDMESVTEGTVVEWRVAAGDAVAADQILVEISTDKVDLEVPSPAAGVLQSIAVQAGETFAVGQPLGEIAAGAGPTSAPAPEVPSEPVPSEAPAPETSAPASASPPTPPEAPAPPGWPAISPLARREALRRGIDLTAVSGSGPGGIIRQGDLAAADGNGGGDGGAVRPPEVPPVDGEREVPLRGPARALAAYMDDSLSIPTATSFRTLNVGVLDAQRRSINAALTAVEGGKVSFTHLIAWAIVRAAAEISAMNTGYAVGEDGPERLEREFVNLGLAVDVERKDGSRSLLVPVVRGAEAMDFAAFRAAFDDLVGRTRGGGISPDELRGATVTLTNPGGIGTVASVPRLMLGQGTIVATGAIGYPPGLERTPVETLTTLGVDKVMNITSTYDHRVIQGAQSGEFLGRVAGLLTGDDDFYAQVRNSLGLTPETVAQPATPVALSELTSGAPASAPAAPLDDEELIEAVSGAMSVVKAHRTHGHLAADLDPLGAPPSGDPALLPETVGLTPESMARIPSSVLRIRVPGATFAEALPHLRRTYCGTLAFEIEHIAKHQKRVWLRERIESGWVVEPLSTVRRLELLERLIQVDAFERFLRRTYLGQKTFSVEGMDALVPMLDEIIEELADDGVSDVMIGMAHRGRLAVMCHTVGRPPESILAEFEGHMEFDAEDDDTVTPDDDPPDVAESAGDVKYHLGAEGSYVTRAARAITVRLAANPSHLEQVNAVVEGESRANQTVRSGRAARQDSNIAVPVLVHGDAAFTGQGVVAETLNLSSIDGYSTGGTIHIIANNQIGFTTDPEDARSSRYASDPAKGYDIPIIHVNADDVDACMSAVKLAVAYRQRYGRDVVIDLVGYRRFGHNELDEPGYTQPVMARTIKGHSPVSRLYAQKLMAEGILTQERLDEVVAWAEKRMADGHASVRAQLEQGTFSEREDFESATDGGTAVSQPVRTSVPEKGLRSLNEQLLTVPDDFTLHPKLVPQLERRRTDLEEGGITWAHAEALALASLLTQGVPIRLTGQDAARGTFSQRHLELHDASESLEWSPLTGRTHVPMANLLRASAAFELHNSPLSEAAAVGFEYGYSVQAPEALVLWEAQYGDFANGAQIMIDQFIVSGSAKWGQRSRLTLLLPHGYEGNGPEHSSARIERFLQLAGDDNIRVAIPSTAAQYFHLLRKQALTRALRPLVVFTPKSLLRHRGAASTLQHLTDGHFEPVLADPRVADPAGVRRLLLCTGKVFHDLDGHAERAGLGHVAVGRVEMLYPFPDGSVRALVASYPDLEEVVWVQEEPRNMGAWGYIGRRIAEQLPEGLTLAYAGRPRRATPSEGYPQAHQTEQRRLLAEALGLEVPV